jgi:tetratricopeptide (TPR) repeat protein
LLSIRLYKPAVELLSKVNTGDSSLELINALKVTQPYQSLTTSDKDVSAFVRKMLTLVVGPDDPDDRALEMFLKVPGEKNKTTDPEVMTADSLRGLANYLRNTAVPDLLEQVRGDVFLSNLNLTAEGDDAAGYRVAIRCLGLSNLNLYVIKSDGRYEILPMQEAPSIGRIALAQARNNELAAARKWLDWEREEQSIPGGEDPLNGPVFPRVWRKGQAANKEAVERAAAVLLLDSQEIAPLLPALQAAREHALDDSQRSAYDLALFRAYSTLKRWPEARVAAERLLKASADSDTAFQSFVLANFQLKDWGAVEKASKERLDRNPDDTDAVAMLADNAERQGHMEVSLAILREALKQLEPKAPLLNNYAWNALFVSHMPDDAMDAAQHAARLTENKDFGVMHTLASVYAEVGRVGEARQLMIHLLDENNVDEPNSVVWYVFGRIAEQYGRNQAAVNAYKRVEKDDDDEPRPNSTYKLAQHAVERLSVAPKEAGSTQVR